MVKTVPPGENHWPRYKLESQQSKTSTQREITQEVSVEERVLLGSMVEGLENEDEPTEAMGKKSQ